MARAAAPPPNRAAPGSDANTLLTAIRQASAHLDQGRRTEALLVYHDVSEKAGSHAQVQFELGNLCHDIGDPHKAISHYLIAVEQTPDNAQLLTRLGLAYLNDGDPEKARAAFERATGIDENLAEAHHGLGVYHSKRADFEKAVVHLERACAQKPSSVEIRKNLSFALAECDRHDEALAHARKAVRLNGSDPAAHLLLAEILARIGQMDEAVKLLEQTIRRHRTFGFAYDMLARLRRFSESDDPFIQQAEKMLDKSMSPGERFCLRFALGKMHDDRGRYDEAFAHYEQANLQQKRAHDISEDETSLKRMQKLFTAESIRAFASSGNASAQPVFIVGMPRSGTTLMERIIASHPRAAGAGELPELARLAGTILPPDGGRGVVARARADLSAQNIAGFAEDYLSVLRQSRPDTDRIVDKMPGNFLFIGLIKSLFPNATIINAV
ncbi:MAG: tetratricopeptide repeat-containing sulfotransferase family protein, partial [Gammaproteobacteria bacterium]